MPKPVLEAAAGQPLDAILHDRLASPAAMRDTARRSRLNNAVE